ncbi:MAG: polysaccharide deacetylase family protein [Deltaproteobacteria bacterium]|nr:polysaccharide deacetylase family protein [Deltaproteobacteria bacterium]
MRNTSLLLLSLVSVLGAACTDEDCATDDEACHGDEETALFEQAYEEGQQEGKEDGTDCSGVRIPDRTGFNKRIALTFDDGPNPATTPKVIEVLKAHGAPATFFINGHRISAAGTPALRARAAEIAAQIAADPLFILANHSQGHLNLSEQTLTKVGTEVMATDALIRAAGETPRYFRFPFGASTCATLSTVRSKGYISTGWTIDSADWCYAKGNGVCTKATFKWVPDQYRNSMTDYTMSQVRSSNGGVLLFHDVHGYTANSLDALLTTLTQEGYTFVPLSDTAAFPRLHGATVQPSTAKFIGDACTTNAQCAFTAAGAAGRCHPAGFCTISCNGSCPDLAGKAPTFCIADASSTAAAGICSAKPSTYNTMCTALPRTAKRLTPRYIGTSTAVPAQAEVCAPL